MITKFLHTAFEVEDLEEAIKFYESLGFAVTKEFDKPEPQAKVAHMSSANDADIEIWQFIDKQHPQVEFIRRHVAVESDNLDEDVQSLLDQGCELVIPVTQGVVLRYAFIKDPSGNYIEIGQRK